MSWLCCFGRAREHQADHSNARIWNHQTPSVHLPSGKPPGLTYSNENPTYQRETPPNDYGTIRRVSFSSDKVENDPAQDRQPTFFGHPFSLLSSHGTGSNLNLHSALEEFFKNPTTLTCTSKGQEPFRSAPFILVSLKPQIPFKLSLLPQPGYVGEQCQGAIDLYLVERVNRRTAQVIASISLYQPNGPRKRSFLQKKVALNLDFGVPPNSSQVTFQVLNSSDSRWTFSRDKEQTPIEKERSALPHSQQNVVHFNEYEEIKGWETEEYAGVRKSMRLSIIEEE